MTRPWRMGSSANVPGACALRNSATRDIVRAARATRAAADRTSTPASNPATKPSRIAAPQRVPARRHSTTRRTPLIAALLACALAPGADARAEWKVEDCQRDVQPAGAAPDTLRADLVFGGQGVLETPTSVRFAPDGRILVADANHHRVAVFNESGRLLESIGRRGGGPGEFYGPAEFDLDVSGALLVADTGNERLQLRARDGKTRVLQRDFVPRSVCALGNGAFLAQADPNGEPLFERIGPDGRVRGGFGETVRDSLERRHVQDALNRVSASRFDDGRIAVAFQTLSEVRVYSPEGRVLSRFHVRGREFEEMRCYAYFGRLASYIEPDRRPEPDPSIRRLIQEVALACGDGAPHGTLYIGGIATFAGRVYVIANGVILAYDDGGTLIRRYLPRGPHGEPLFSHGLSIDPDGRLAVWDTFHSYEVRLFRLPSLAETAPARSSG